MCGYGVQEHEAYLPVPGAGFAVDGRERERGEEVVGVATHDVPALHEGEPDVEQHESLYQPALGSRARGVCQ